MSHDKEARSENGERVTRSPQPEEAKRREEAIRSLAAMAHAVESISQGAPRLSSDSEVAKRRSAISRRRLMAIVATLVVILIVVGAIVRNTFSSGPVAGFLHPTPATLRLDLNALGYSCPSAMAWSPDGSKLAVLAQRGSITPDQAGDPCSGDTLLVFDTQRGLLLQHFDIATPLKAAGASLTLRHDVPSWSPDGITLAVPCVVATQIPARPVDMGVLLISTNGGHTVLAHAGVDLSRHTVTAVWNTQTRTLASATQLPLAPALEYQTSASGNLIRSKPLTSGGVGSGFTGHPQAKDAGVHSLWQSGALIVVSGDTTPSTADRPSLVFYSATLGMWSPDGKYVDPQATLGSIGFPDDADALKSFGSQPCAKIGLAPCVAAPVPYPDRALMVVKAKLLEQNGAQTYLADVPVAWRPDGKVLAAVFPSDSFTRTNDAVHVTLLSTSDGHVLKTLSSHTSSASDSGGFDDLMWSPTGNQLAFRDTYTAAITLWGGSNLDGLG